MPENGCQTERPPPSRCHVHDVQLFLVNQATTSDARVQHRCKLNRIRSYQKLGPHILGQLSDMRGQFGDLVRLVHRVQSREPKHVQPCKKLSLSSPFLADIPFRGEFGSEGGKERERGSQTGP